jgi:outer membrane protein
MKGKNRWFGLSLALVFVLLVSMSIVNVVMAESTSLKIGFVDMNKILIESKAAKNARAILQKDIDSKKAIIKEKSDKLANMDKDLKNTEQDSSAWKEKREKLAQEINEFNRLKGEADGQLKKKDTELTEKIITDIQKILKNIAKSEKYAIILDKKAALIAEDGLDLTDKVIKLYDSQKK